MRLIYASGFNVKERKQWRSVAFNNIVTSLAQMVQKMEEDEISLSNPANHVRVSLSLIALPPRWPVSPWLTPRQHNAELVKAEPDIDIDTALPVEYLEVFQALWADSGVQAAVSRGNEYAIQDNLA